MIQQDSIVSENSFRVFIAYESRASDIIAYPSKAISNALQHWVTTTGHSNINDFLFLYEGKIVDIERTFQSYRLGNDGVIYALLRIPAIPVAPQPPPPILASVPDCMHIIATDSVPLPNESQYPCLATALNESDPLTHITSESPNTHPLSQSLSSHTHLNEVAVHPIAQLSTEQVTIQTLMVCHHDETSSVSRKGRRIKRSANYRRWISWEMSE